MTPYIGFINTGKSLTMAVYVNNITINTGAYFYRDYYLDNSNGTPLDLTGYSAASQIRKHPDSLNAAASMNVGFIDRTNGHIRVSLASTITTTIKPGRYAWDILFTDSNGKKSVLIEGNVLASADITPQCVVTDYANATVGVIIETSTDAGSSPEPDANSIITINDISNYGVVHIGTNFNQCSKFDIGSSTTRDMLENETQRQSLINYMQRGGVVWFNSEWWNQSATERNCSDKANINAMLTLLGTEIRASTDTIITSSVRSNQSSVINSGFPETQVQNASVIFTGGTPVYVNGSDTITAYEKIGSGILYVSGDSNTFSGPTYPNSYYTALRNLVLNS